MSGRHAQALAFLIPDDSGLLAAAFALTFFGAARDDIFLPAQSGRQRLPHRMPFGRAFFRAFTLEGLLRLLLWRGDSFFIGLAHVGFGRNLAFGNARFALESGKLRVGELFRAGSKLVDLQQPDQFTQERVFLLQFALGVEEVCTQPHKDVLNLTPHRHSHLQQ